MAIQLSSKGISFSTSFFYLLLIFVLKYLRLSHVLRSSLDIFWSYRVDMVYRALKVDVDFRGVLPEAGSKTTLWIQQTPLIQFFLAKCVYLSGFVSNLFTPL